MLKLLNNPIVLIILLPLILALFFFFLMMLYAKRISIKMKKYRQEIGRSHSLILKLEVKNEQLSQRIAELEQSLMLKKTA